MAQAGGCEKGRHIQKGRSPTFTLLASRTLYKVRRSSQTRTACTVSSICPRHLWVGNPFSSGSWGYRSQHAPRQPRSDSGSGSKGTWVYLLGYTPTPPFSYLSCLPLYFFPNPPSMRRSLLFCIFTCFSFGGSRKELFSYLIELFLSQGSRIPPPSPFHLINLCPSFRSRLIFKPFLTFTSRSIPPLQVFITSCICLL